MKDTQTKNLITMEEKRQRECINLIPSENYASRDVREACASVFMNKYSEGYPGARYYPGNEYVDEIEILAQERAKKVFGLGKNWHVNVQALSGVPANMAVYYALLKRGDTALGMKLDHGGHLSHGHKVTASGNLFKFIQYGVDKNGYIDYEEIERLAKEHKPKLIVSGASAYSRKIDYKRFKQIAASVNALHMTDMAHIAGLVAGKTLPSPFPHCDIVTTTTHKTLRGPRGALIFCRKKFAKEIDKAVMPGLHGGPHDHQTAAIAVALEEASTEEFRKYAKQVINNSKTLAREFKRYSFNIVSGGTDNHLMLIDLRNTGLAGKEAETMLCGAGISVNRNAVPNDPNPPYRPSGIRIGTPAVTTRGMRKKEMILIAIWIKEILLREKTPEEMKKETLKLVRKFPVP